MITHRKYVVGYADKIQFPQLHSGFLGDLASSRLLWRFARLDPATGQLPFKGVRFGLSFAKQYFLTMSYDDRYATGNAAGITMDKTLLSLGSRYLNSMVYCGSIVDQILRPYNNARYLAAVKNN